jgi:hypothetical protein
VSQSAIASGYWPAQGGGAGFGSTGTLAAPTSVTASAAAATVTVNWTAPSAPNGGAVNGVYVLRYSGGVASAACGSSIGSLLVAASGSCADTGVVDGTYTYTVVSAFGGWTAESSASNSVTIQVLNHFVVTAPSSTVAGSSMTVTVTATNSSGSTITNFVGTVHFASSDPGSPTLPVDYTFIGADAGTHTFSSAVSLKTATSQSITVNDTSDVTKTGTTNVTVTPASASKVAFSNQPGGGTATTSWSAQPIVAIQDTYGNTVTTSSAPVTLAIVSNPGGGSLTCTANPVAATSGLASYTGCKIDKSGNGYTLIASSSGLTSATSTSFNIAVGAATKLVFTQQPGGGTGGTSFATQPIVAVEDAGGNIVTTDTSTITVARTSGTGTSGATLTCTANALAATAGISTFAGCRIDKSGNNYTVTATASGLTSAVSSTFNVTIGAAVQLAFTQQPSTTLAGDVINPAPRVAVQDAGGNTITSSTATITLAIGTNPSSGHLSGTLSVNAVSGVATFSNLSIDLTGTGYTLNATSTGLTAATSSAFNVNLYRLVFTQQPGGGTGGTAFGTQPIVAVEDGAGNVITSDTSTITVARTSGTGTSGATLTCTPNALAATAGVATFSGCRIDKSGNNYTVTATATGLTSAVSSTLNVTIGAAVQLAFTQQPSTTLVGDAISPAPTVTVQDAGGNTVTTSSATVTVAIGTNPGSGSMSGTLSVNAVSGVATFGNLNLDTAGSGYTLSATGAALTTATSSSFTMNLYKLVFTGQPGGGTGGTAFAVQPSVAVEDHLGNIVTSNTSTITVARTSGTGTSGATLTCTPTALAATAGIANYSGCKIDKAGNNYTITATATGAVSAVSAAFNVTVGSATKVAFTQQPSSTVHGSAFATQPVVTVQDAGGNTVTSSAATVTLAISTNPGGGTLTCSTNPLSATAGLTTFAGCSITTAGNGYRLSASSPGLASATSNSLNIT